MKIRLFLFFGVCLSLILFACYIWRQDNPHNPSAPESLPTAQPLPKVQEVLLPFPEMTWDLPRLNSDSAQKEALTRYKADDMTNKSALWNHISFGRCDMHPMNPAYLEQKMQKNSADKRSSFIGNMDCGLIRTKIPFSF